MHATHWVDAVIEEDRLKLANAVSDDRLTELEGPIDLQLRGARKGDNFHLTLTATSNGQEISVATDVPAGDIAGGVALLSDGPNRSGGAIDSARHEFANFSLNGDCIIQHPDRSFGPILWSQYTLDRDRLRLQAQFAPLGPRPDHRAELWVEDVGNDSSWQRLAEAPLKKLSRTTTFTIENWDSSQPRDYQVRFRWQGIEHVWSGTIREEPEAAEPLKLACFSCDNGYLFPIPAMVEQARRQDPDMLYFAGDQIYENYGGFGVARNADLETAMLDYLRKYYQFGWTWRELLRDRPSVILADDHDVFQGNLWGHGGRALPAGNGTNWADGGYVMPGEWVTAVEQTQVGHLPDPAVEYRSQHGISAYYTDLVYGGIGFAILEDRKFKTGPNSLPIEVRATGKGGELLGAEQEAFLERWSRNWTGHEMKCALSQTIFCTAATHAGANLARARGFTDSGAWPVDARHRVVRILGDAHALAIHGDQHLGILLRQGVDTFDDAGYAFMVPGTANGFPRAWWPGVEGQATTADQKFTGRFRDDAGHPIHVLAVGNPEPGSNRLPRTTDPMEIGRRKGSGYGLVEFDKQSGDATITLYRLGNDEATFDDFPQTVHVGNRQEVQQNRKR